MVEERLRTDTTTVYTVGGNLVIERVFDAPRDLVWNAMTDPERVTKWWGPRGYTTVVEMDVRPGGKWRCVNNTPDGEDVPFKGEYVEVLPPERFIRTSIFDVPGFDDKAAVETLTLDHLGGRTKVALRDRFPTVDDLEGAVSRGMIRDAVEAWDRLAALLSEP